MSSSSSTYFAVILAGGVGSRFWPMSRKDMPKQFLDVTGNGRSLFQQTYERFKAICDEHRILVVTNQRYVDIIRKQVPGIAKEQIIAEPLGRNTAPCIAYAAHKIKQRVSDAAMIVGPSDHYIGEEAQFINTARHGLAQASEHQYLITLGIKPSRPDTGYGYIQFDEDKYWEGVHKVKTFTEKPDEKLAKRFIESGDFLWNSGIFIWHVDAILQAFAKHAPEIHELFGREPEAWDSDREAEFVKETYSLCPSISIDYAVMEKAQNVYVIPAQFAWSDIGTWNSLYSVVEKDAHRNVVLAEEAIVRHSQRNICFVSDNTRLVALNGVEDLIVVEADGLLLVAHRHQEQEVRNLVNEIKAQYGEKFT
jgi:mannose-1-phosphate guanylyltransferase